MIIFWSTKSALINCNTVFISSPLFLVKSLNLNGYLYLYDGKEYVYLKLAA